MTELPMTLPSSGLPAHVTIYEVGARDGLQNEKTVVPVEVKREFIDRLTDAVLHAWRQVRADLNPTLMIGAAQ